MQSARPRPRSPREVLRQLGVGRLAMRYFHQPLQPYRWLAGFGARGAMRHVWGENRMRAAARRLAPMDIRSGPAFAVTYLTGHRHWHQSAFAACSLALRLSRPLQPTFVDDGSLRDDEVATLRRVFPNARVIRAAEVTRRLAEHLPAAEYPALHAARQTHAFMRKLLDIRAGSPDWQLYLDSDMLFFREPHFLADCAAGRIGCYMVDRVDAYVCGAERLSSLVGRPVPARANGGIVGLDDGRIDWRQLEQWARTLPPGAMLEQTLTAMLHGQQASRPAPEPDYHILYNSTDAGPAEPTLLHYIYRAKLRFFADDWRRIWTQATGGPRQP